MPNMDDGIRGFDTPSEKNYFSRESYLVHVTSLVILQFYLARFSNNIIITGRHGCGFFNNNDRDVAAIFHAVSQMPEFKNIQIIFALGEDKTISMKNKEYSLHEIYRKPSHKIIKEVEAAIKQIRKAAPSFTPLAIATNLMTNYEKAKKTGIEINGINICIDNFFIDPNRRPDHNKMKLWESNHYNIDELKNNIREGLHADQPLNEIYSAWEKKNHCKDKNTSDLLKVILDQFDFKLESPRL